MIADFIKLMEDPKTWPSETLSLKRVGKGGPSFGVAVAKGDGFVFVPGVSIWAGSDRITDLCRIKGIRPTPAELAAAGWDLD